MNPAMFLMSAPAAAPAGAAESGSVVVMVVAGASLVVLIVLVLLVNAIGTRLARIEARLADVATNAPAAAAGVQPEGAPAAAKDGGVAHGEFERFLAEDPKRLLLAKKEQAAAYRVWRKEQGLTWNAAGR